MAAQALAGAAIPDAVLHPVLVVDGSESVVSVVRRRPFTPVGLRVRAGRIVEIDAIVDPERIQRLAAHVLAPAPRIHPSSSRTAGSPAGI